MNLFHLTGRMIELDALLTESGGEMSPEVESAWLDLSQDQAETFDQLVNLMRTKQARAEAAKLEAQRYADIARREEHGANCIEARMKDFLILTGQKSIRTATNRTVSVQANGGVQALALAEGLDMDTIPDEFVRIMRTINTEATRKALEAGGTLPFASLKPRGMSLRIR